MSNAAVPYISVATSKDARCALCDTRKRVESRLHYDPYGYPGLLSLLNCLGCGQDVTKRELTRTVMEVVGSRATIAFDISKLDGTPQKLLYRSCLAALGISARTPLRGGITRAYESAPFHH
jgi:hypothetical protein